jgi:hypothetical protein
VVLWLLASILWLSAFARQIIEKENLMKWFGKLIVAISISLFAGSAALADGYKDCTKQKKALWKPASDAEAKAKAAGYEVRRSKVEGSCYEVYGVKEGKLYELFYSPEDLSLKHTIAK